MAAGLGEASAIFSVVSLAIQLFQGCVEGYKICHTAQNIGRDGDLLNTKLVVQRTRLEAWAMKAGFPDGPIKRLHWEPIILILGQQQGLLRSARDLQDRYSLTLREDALVAEDGGGNEGYFTTQDTDTANLVMRLRPRFVRVQTDSIRQIQADGIRRRNPMRRMLTWAIGDKTKLEQIILNITGLNTQLQEYLHDYDLADIRLELDALYRALVSQCRGTGEVENVRQSIPNAAASIVAAAQVKELRLALDFDKRDGEVAPEPGQSVQMKDFKHFKEQKLSAVSYTHLTLPTKRIV